MMFLLGMLTMYVVTGVAIYALGSPLKSLVSGDAKVTWLTVLKWPLTTKALFEAGVSRKELVTDQRERS